MPPRVLTDGQIRSITMKYVDGRTSTSLATEYNVNSETIRKWLKRRGILMRQSRAALAAHVDTNYFAVIDTSIKAYWLGFLVADACIGKSAGDRRALRFYTKDEWPPQQFAEDIEFSGKLRPPELSRGQTGIVFNNKAFCGHLINIGYLDWKAGDPCLLELLDDGLFHHFVRGFFDGDGCISCSGGGKRKRKTKQYWFNFSADHKHNRCLGILEEMIARSVGLPIKGVKIRKNCCTIGWNGNNQVRMFGEWMYCGATRFLQRKRDRFDVLGRMTFELSDLVLRRVDVSEYNEFYGNYHYMGKGGRKGYTLGAYLDGGLIAAATIGSITRAEIAIKQGCNSAEVRELARFCIKPGFHLPNFSTWFLSRTIKYYLREHDIKLFVSFADQTKGHEGTIYRAANWKYDGETGRSYHYEDIEGSVLHKKTIYGKAKKLDMIESEYVKFRGLIKIPHKPKKRFLYWTGRKSRYQDCSRVVSESAG